MEKPQKPADFEALAGKTAPNPANGLQIAGNTDPVFQTRAELVAPGTPLPWSLNLGNETELMAGKFNVARAHCGGMTGIRLKDAEANAAYIAHAANCFPELVEALRNVLDGLGALANPSELQDWLPEHEADAVFAALAKAVTP